MFVQPIIGRSVVLGIRQVEELFCDFVGLCLFGKSYLFAFDYVISPTICGSRIGDYPNTKTTRAILLVKYGEQLGFKMDGYENRFIDEKMPGVNEQDFLVKMADIAVSTWTDRIFEIARNHVFSSVGTCLVEEHELYARKCFAACVPTPKSISLGDLINAAWAVHNDMSLSKP
jgi:hypothetical protein